MRAFFRRVRALLEVYYALMVEYRAELYLWVLAGLIPLIMMGIWMKVAGGQGSRLGLTPGEVSRYFAVVFLVRQFTVVWVIYEFEFHVLHGRLSPFLLQPLDPGWRFIAQHFSEQAARLPFSLGIVAAVFLIYPESRFTPQWGNVLLAVPAIYLAFAARFCLQYSIAMASFWIERAGAIEEINLLFYIFLSGQVAPLSAFPDLAREIVLLTPYPYLLYFPVQLITGLHPQGWSIDPVRGFAVLGGWLVVFYVLNRVVWRRGLKRYSAMGA